MFNYFRLIVIMVIVFWSCFSCSTSKIVIHEEDIQSVSNIDHGIVIIDLDYPLPESLNRKYITINLELEINGRVYYQYVFRSNEKIKIPVPLGDNSLKYYLYYPNLWGSEGYQCGILSFSSGSQKEIQFNILKDESVVLKIRNTGKIVRDWTIVPNPCFGIPIPFPRTYDEVRLDFDKNSVQ